MIGIIGVLLLLVLAAIIFRNPLLKAITCWNIRSNTGLQTSIGAFDLDLSSSRLKINQFRIYNAPPFGRSLFVDIPEVFFEIDAGEAGRGKVRFKEIRFNLAEANVVRATNGATNIDAIKKQMEAHPGRSGRPHTNAFEFGGVDKLTVSLGKINFIDFRQPENNTKIELGVTNEIVRNLKTAEDLQNWATALVIRLAIQQSFSGSAGQPKSKTLELLIEQLR